MTDIPPTNADPPLPSEPNERMHRLLEILDFPAYPFGGLNLNPDEMKATYPKLYPFQGIQLERSDIEILLEAWANDPRSKSVGLDLRGADLRGVNLDGLALAGVRFGLSHAEWFNLPPNVRDPDQAHRDGSPAQQERRIHAGVLLQGAFLKETHLENASLRAAHLEGADLRLAHLQGANLQDARLEGADLRLAHLEGASLNGAHLESTSERPSADLRLAFLDDATTLKSTTLGDAKGYVRLADVRWGGANLAEVIWGDTRQTLLRDEKVAEQSLEAARKATKEAREDALKQAREDWQATVRAYRQLALALRNQGVNEIADDFAYRSRLCQQHVLQLQPKKRGEVLWNRFLDRTSGYGFKPQRTLVMYGVTLSFFAIIFWGLSVLGKTAQPVTWYEALVLSVSSFHGRGFFPMGIPIGDSLAIASVFEAVIGLFIEVSFIATFTQRFFSR